LSQLTLSFFCAALFVISVLYSCVGQAGASGYIAAMALFGFAPAAIKPTALVLNVLVSAIVSLRFYRAGYFSRHLFWPLALASVPAALLGGCVTLPTRAFNCLLGALLLVGALPFVFNRQAMENSASTPRLSRALLAGGGVGLLSGLTGVGGGVLITPLLLHCRWARAKTAAGVSAVFILVNSVAALSGHLSVARSLPSGLPLYASAAVLGGALGSQLGSAHLSAPAIHRILGAVLLIAGLKLLLT
jgi:uncharacterized membrane protein YfcA